MAGNTKPEFLNVAVSIYIKNSKAAYYSNRLYMFMATKLVKVPPQA